jgi:hypothetical protein
VVARLRALTWIAAGALALWFALPHFVNYDTAWSLVWGGQIAHGGAPRLDVPLAPTPHPLTTLVGVALAPLGTGSATVTLGLAFVSLAAMGWLGFALASAWFGRAAGWLAAALLLSSGSILWFGARAYLDVPYVALMLGALLVETRRRRAGAPVLALLAAAGLLRPEAWAFAAAYAAYAARGRDRYHAVGLVMLAASAPATWLACDLALTGDPLHSLTWTREAAAALGRPRGAAALLTALPDKLATTAGMTVLVGGAAGLVAALGSPRRVGRLPAAALGLTLAASAALTAAGMPVVMRYELLCAALLTIMCAGAALGWLGLPVGHPRRRPGRLLGLAVLALLAVALPARLGSVLHRRDQLGVEASLRGDLHALADTSLPRGCGPVTVASHKLVPLLALWTGRTPTDFRSGPGPHPRRGLWVGPAGPGARGFLLAASDPGEAAAAPPHDGAELARDRTWRAVGTCAGRGGEEWTVHPPSRPDPQALAPPVARAGYTRCACR